MPCTISILQCCVKTITRQTTDIVYIAIHKKLRYILQYIAIGPRFDNAKQLFNPTFFFLKYGIAIKDLFRQKYQN